jgi:hypothetical protein
LLAGRVVLSTTRQSNARCKSKWVLTFARAVRATAIVIIHNKSELLFFLFQIELIVYAFIFFKVFFL